MHEKMHEKVSASQPSQYILDVFFIWNIFIFFFQMSFDILKARYQSFWWVEILSEWKTQKQK